MNRISILLIAAAIMCASPVPSVFAETKYSIKQMTPEVQGALDNRRDRYDELRTLKSDGVLGENSRGYVEVLDAKGNANAIAAAENKDRRVIYETIARQNGLESAIATIEAVFAQVQKDKAESGDRIQTSDGTWIKK